MIRKMREQNYEVMSIDHSLNFVGQTLQNHVDRISRARSEARNFEIALKNRPFSKSAEMATPNGSKILISALQEI
jgi:hypothetical protein